jgi:hypothetical protein
VQYAPEVRLHSEEKYLPSSVDWYLARVSMYFYIGQSESLQVLKSVSIDNITDCSYTYQTWGGGVTYRSGSGDKLTGFYLKIGEKTTRTGYWASTPTKNLSFTQLLN